MMREELGLKNPGSRRSAVHTSVMCALSFVVFGGISIIGCVLGAFIGFPVTGCVTTSTLAICALLHSSKSVGTDTTDTATN